MVIGTESTRQFCAGRGEIGSFPPLADTSAVMRDTIHSCSGTPKEVSLSDPKIECATVIERFLEISAKGKLLNWTNDFKMCETLCDTVAFMRKYDCERPLAILRMHVLNQLLLKQLAPLYFFMVAAAMDDVELSILAFRHRYDVTYFKAVENQILPAMTGSTRSFDFISFNARGGAGSITDPDSTWPYQLWAIVPADYLWAATRAWNRTWTSQTVVNAKENPPCTHGYANYPGYVCATCNQIKAKAKQITDVDIAAEYEKAIGEVKKVKLTG